MFIGGVIQRQYLLCHRVQRDYRFHVRFLPVDADIFPAVCRCPDMSGVQPSGVGIGKPREAGEDESPSAQFRCPFGHRCFHNPFQFLPTDVFVLGGRLLLVFHLLHGICPDDFIVHRKVKQPVQPAETAVCLCGAEILAPDKKSLVTRSELFRDFLESDVLLSHGDNVVGKVLLKILGMAVGGVGIYLH